ncbi:hypothetical protein EO95_05235 [Methanosarcina sp. 1.H.T.1A.1]|uniref:hypothetical protein n=1 Tax=Methanosarcina sp. 1.H.T.1A.1 TaxID=1483602 RepID=UPI000621587E|nr:hypothetical protein [Methanosarcina sp. 1.H.T.1A.1]KKH92642.1 hypothetical protein EO95_05235 [Methanosarcina sp. 1.H.T.1A.1]
MQPSLFSGNSTAKYGIAVNNNNNNNKKKKRKRRNNNKKKRKRRTIILQVYLGRKRNLRNLKVSKF